MAFPLALQHPYQIAFLPALSFALTEGFCLQYNGIVYTSGVIGVNPATGEVGETIEEQTTQVFENLKGLLADAGSSLDQAIKTTVFIKNMDDFAKVNEIYATYFTGAFPARSCVEVARLPKDLLIEVEVTAIKG